MSLPQLVLCAGTCRFSANEIWIRQVWLWWLFILVVLFIEKCVGHISKLLWTNLRRYNFHI